MQNDPTHSAEHHATKDSDDSLIVSSSPPSNQIENPEKVLLERFRESRQSILIQVYFYGGITVFALCAAIFLMMYLA
jgi:hypothetical protein